MKNTLKFKKSTYLALAILCSCFACDPDKTVAPGPVLAKTFVKIITNDTTLNVGNQLNVVAQFTNEQNEVSKPNFSWLSTNISVISVDGFGLGSALKIGQAYIVATYQGKSDSVLVTVIPGIIPNTVVGDNMTTPGMNTMGGSNMTGTGNNTSVAGPNISVESIIVLSSMGNSFTEGNTLQLSATAYNSDGEELKDQIFTWNSENKDIATVSGNGLVTGLSSGTARILATIGDKSSIAIVLNVKSKEPVSRSGSFKGFSGYSISGSVSLNSDNGGNLKVEIGSNFTASSGPDLRVYLGNAASGSSILSSGLELALLKANSGAQTYNVPANVKITDYNYVVIQCKQFNVTFGSAQLNP